MSDHPRLLYLIGQFPAINHAYIFEEIKLLRTLGFEVFIASISPPDRPLNELSSEEREETAHTYYIKSVHTAEVLRVNLMEFMRHPLRYLRGLTFALRLGARGPKQAVYHLAYFAEAVLIGRFMRERGISHVHANFSATVSLLVAHTFPATMSFVAHGYGELHDPTATHLRERIQGSSFVRAVSRFGRSQMMLCCDRNDWPKLVSIPLGIDAARYPPAPPRANHENLTVVCVGRLAPEKGQEILLEAVTRLKGQGRSLRLRLVGDGPDRAWLESRASALGIASHVEFVGWVQPELLRDVYAETDLCVLSSLAEGVPVVLMEAMAMQIACVAPRITGIPELIEHGVDGLLFTAGDVTELSEQIGMLLDSRELRLTVGRAARVRVLRDYDLATNTKRFAAVLREHLA